MFIVTKIPIPGTGGGGGEANTGSNAGAGAQLFKNKLGVALVFRSLVQGSGITLTQNADDVTITSTSGNPSASENVEAVTLTAPQIAAKQITLAGTPAVPAEVKLDVVGGSAQEYVTDFTVAGNVLSWSGLGLETLVSAGDKLRISYFV